jgi:amidohydrolase
MIMLPHLSESAMPLPNDIASHLKDAAAAIEPRLIEIRRDIHSVPELAFQEVRTAGIVVAELTRLGIAHRTGVGGTGVIGTIDGGRPGPTLAIRADMDALPIHEETGQEFASTVDGQMHACGHDIHTTTLLGVAELLKELAPNLAGRIQLIFQPAEEVLEGAEAMIADGAAEGLDMALAFHNMPDMPVGEFGFVRGHALAASDRFDIIVQGKSGHAAHPYASVDPIVAASHLITQLQTVVAREQKPLHPCVVTVGMFSGGTTYNIIPERVALKGTVRTLQPEARDVAEAAIRRLCAGLGDAMRCKIEVNYRRMVPSLRNDDAVLEPAIASVAQNFGKPLLQKDPSMGAEDFSAFADRVPSFHLLVGSGAPGRDDRLHNAFYQPDEACLALGVQALSRIAVDMLR